MLLVIATTGLLLLQTSEGRAQGGTDSVIAQTVRSTRGYMIRIPATATLDSIYDWAKQQVIGSLGGRTVQEALDAGEPPKRVWRAVWETLRLAERER